MEQRTITYDDAIVRRFIVASVIFGVVGMLVGAIIATQLAWWQANLGVPYLTFSRLRPLHTNAVIFAFVGNMMFAGIYYSTQRLLKARMASRPARRRSTSGAGRLIIVAAAITLPLGITHGQGVRRARVADRHRDRRSSGSSSRSTSSGRSRKRNEKHLYVAIWFYIATIVTVAVLHIVNSLAIPVIACQELLGLRRRAGRAGAVVVRAQRGRLLPDHADPRHHVLLPAEGGGAAGLLATGSRSSTSGRWSSSTSGPGRTTCSTPRCRTGRSRSA